MISLLLFESKRNFSQQNDKVTAQRRTQMLLEMQAKHYKAIVHIGTKKDEAVLRANEDTQRSRIMDGEDSLRHGGVCVRSFLSSLPGVSIHPARRTIRPFAFLQTVRHCQRALLSTPLSVVSILFPHPLSTHYNNLF